MAVNEPGWVSHRRINLLNVYIKIWANSLIAEG